MFQSDPADWKIEISVLEELSRQSDALVTFVGATMNPPILVTEFLPRGCLDNYLRSEGALHRTSREKLQMALHVIESIFVLHNHKPIVIHRDVKPQNFVLDNQLRPKLCDFGLAKKLDDKVPWLHLPHAPVSPRYAAPEAICYDGPIGRPSDMWSLGCVVNEVFGGKEPYAGIEDKDRLIHDMKRGITPTLWEYMDQTIRRVVQQCFVWEPSRRITVGDLCRIFKQEVQRGNVGVGAVGHSVQSRRIIPSGPHVVIQNM